MKPEEIIVNAIRNVVADLGMGEVDFSVEHPADETRGDYATNVAMIAAKLQKTNPRELAEKIKDELDKDEGLVKVVEKIEVAGPAFINFFLRNSVFITEVKKIVSDQWEKPLVGKKISVEYTDPNPFKEFHIGHLYSNSIGEAIARVYEECGATVWRADFYGDVGMHVAKSIWGIRKKMKEEGIVLADLEKIPFKERQHFLGQGYALGVNTYDADEGVQGEVKKLNQLIFVAGQEYLKKKKGWQPVIDYRRFIEGREQELSEIQPLYEAGLKWSLEYFETYYQRLGTTFDGYYPESWVGEYGVKEVEKGLILKVLEKSKGAVVFPGEKYGLHTRVFLNKLGLPTYEAKDLGLVMAKYDDFKFDLSLNIFGREIDEYYKVVHKAMSLIEPELAAKQTHLAHGMVNLPTGKMSSRTGTVITVEWLLDEAVRRAKALITNEELSEEEKDRVAEVIGVGAVKYALLKSGVGGNVTFDFGQSVSFEGASGPYLQYVYARTCGVLAKAKNDAVLGEDTEMNREEKSVVRQLLEYPEIVSKAAELKAPNLMAEYLFELAQRFNVFYNKHQVIGSEREDFRLGLVSAVGVVMKKGLSLLGINVVERM